MGNRHLEAARSIFPETAPYLHIIRESEGRYRPIPGLTNPVLTTGVICDRPKIGWEFSEGESDTFILQLVPSSIAIDTSTSFPREIVDINAHAAGVIEANREGLERFIQTRSHVSNAIRVSLGNKYGRVPVDQLRFFLAERNIASDIVPLPSRKRIQNYGLIFQ